MSLTKKLQQAAQETFDAIHEELQSQVEASFAHRTFQKRFDLQDFGYRGHCINTTPRDIYKLAIKG